MTRVPVLDNRGRISRDNLPVELLPSEIGRLLADFTAVQLSSNQILNGDFAVDGVWTYGGATTYDAANQRASFVTAGGTISQTITNVKAGDRFLILWTRPSGSNGGTVTVTVGTASSGAVSWNITGAYVVATQNGTLTVTITGSAGYISSMDNVTVRKVMAPVTAPLSIREVSDPTVIRAELRALFDGSVGLGLNALQQASTGSKNVGVGANALATNVTGNSNTGVGHGALAANDQGGSNTAVGEGALAANTNGSLNTAVGSGALKAVTSGGTNVAVGANALPALTTGTNNLVMGSNAATVLTTGGSNVAIGSQAMSGSTTASSNVGIGQLALQSTTTGQNNTAVGSQAGSTSNGTSRVMIGQNAQVTADRAIAIGANSANAVADTAVMKANSLELARVSTTGETAIILTDSAGVRWKLTVSTAGALVVTAA